MIKDLVRENRTIRTFKDTKISDELLMELIDVARLSMCSRNNQSLKYKIVSKDKDVAYIHNLCNYGGYLKDFNPTVEEGPKSFIVLYVDTLLSNISNLIHVDSGIAMANMTLLAKKNGFSSVIIGSFDKKKVKEYFNLNDKLEPLYLIALGEANEIVKIVDVINDDIKYYRKDNVHYVPKRKIDDIIL